MDDIKERRHVESLLRVANAAASAHSLPSALGAGLSNTQPDGANNPRPYGVALGRVRIKIE